MTWARPLATLVATIAAANGKELSIDDLLRAWGHYVPPQTFDPEANERAILAGFGG